ncbi:hypothetical protein DFJ77DRAFT_545423 [Powellomyces hirtus]|nr:hypothetical protein DFJ77DRAFT_545423 [Powellomyces hirtus]
MVGLTGKVTAEIGDIVCRLCQYASEISTPSSLQAAPTGLDKLHRSATEVKPNEAAPTASGAALRMMLLTDMEKLTNQTRKCISLQQPSPSSPSPHPTTSIPPIEITTLVHSLEATALTAAILLPRTRERVLVSVAEVLAVVRAVLEGAGETVLVRGMHAFLDTLGAMDEVGPEVDVWGLKQGVERVIKKAPVTARKEDLTVLPTPYTTLLTHLHMLESSQLRLLEQHASHHTLPLTRQPTNIMHQHHHMATPKVALALVKKECEPALAVRRKLVFGVGGIGGAASGTGSWKLGVCRLGTGMIVVYPPPPGIGVQDLGTPMRDPEPTSTPLHTHILRNASINRTSPTAIGVHLQNGLTLLLDFGDAVRSADWEMALRPYCEGTASRRGSAYSSRPSLARRAVSGSMGNVAGTGMGNVERGSGYLSYPSATSFVI